MEKIFCEEPIKPELSDETLAHYGVKGMKWGRRRGKKSRLVRSKTNKGRALRNITQHIADEVADGKYRDRDGKPNKYGYYEYERTVPYYKRVKNPNSSSTVVSVYNHKGDEVEKALESRRRRKRDNRK